MRANYACLEAWDIGDCLMRKLQHQKIEKVISNKALQVTSDDNVQPFDMSNPKKLELNIHDPLHQGELDFV